MWVGFAFSTKGGKGWLPFERNKSSKVEGEEFHLYMEGKGEREDGIHLERRGGGREITLLQ